MADIKIRSATLEDHPFILSLVSRFVEFGPPTWRDPDSIQRKTEATLLTALENPEPKQAILIAANAEKQPLGFIHLQTSHDYFTDEPYGYISDVAVLDESEGRGVGRALMEAAEQWARTHGYNRLALDVFAQNKRACQFYELLGYHEEVRKYTKTLH